MTSTIVIIHGTENTSAGNWFPWLAAALRQRGVSVIAPDFPTPEGQSLTNWLSVFDAATKGIDPATIVLVGHSTGAVFALRAAERSATAYAGIVAVAAFARDLGLEPYDQLNASFARPHWNWAEVKTGAGHLLLLSGDNDPYVPAACPQEIADATGAELVFIERGGHLNRDSGYTEFPLLLERTLALLPDKDCA